MSLLQRPGSSSSLALSHEALLLTPAHVNVGAILVPAWIGAAYLFTSSTSFANPAVTIARSLTDTFSGIAPDDVPAFIAFQLVGAAVGLALAWLLYPSSGRLKKGS